MKPYKIDVPDSTLADLHARLANTRWMSQVEHAAWRYGAHIAEIRDLCDYWRDGYDWRRFEAEINQIPQFTTEIDGVTLHFLYVKAKSGKGAPLLLLHGWPGSFVEFLKLVRPLTEPEENGGGLAFDVVIPSLPGFGFSSSPRVSGWHADRSGALLHHLMTAVLGYKKYGVQGGDWGSIIGTRMAHAYPHAICGLHINMPFAYPPDASTAGAKEFASRLDAETGYLHLHNTRPDAIAVGLTDSPAGLAAWILEKFRSWSDCHGDVLKHFSRDFLLTNLMTYWAPASIASAARIYFESAQLQPPLFMLPRITVPTGVAAFPLEPYRSPKEWVDLRYNITSWTEMPHGGHFAAVEAPEQLIADVRQFFGSLDGYRPEA